ncbi:MAG: hypothetical protein JWQ90_3222 [Hydrocarboniphaga sp.]|uniref:DUF3014 domain-containing protein n=1 Tax=Hydrocarboniphaga sp. TaxID=2033016 RepID=UPI00260AD415|nr:DUF3014 domain-containing protein [Hydrocarboniphaga sp.]MDB5970772.1 hypothetical protein [Hydrocarboniphaga sp.]
MKARDWALPVIIIVVALAAAAWYFYGSRGGGPATAPAATTSPAPAPEAGTPAEDNTPQNPVPVVPPPSETVPPSPPLPLLGSSDAEMRQSLLGLFDTAPVEAFLVPQDIIRRFVAMIDNLPEPALPMRVRPIRKIDRGFVVQQQDGSLALSPSNAARYAGFVEAVQLADAKRVSEVYFRYYPLFQSAYEELGHPGRYFNDRLVQVIDHLLATPEVAGPIPLARPKVFYQFADPTLESLSAGQKAMIRIGPENAEVVKAKLRELRARIATRHAGGEPAH